nr:hypothetical protein [Tanacetum cinerariifolium]
MNFQPVTAGNQTNPSAGFQDKFGAEKAGEEINQQYVLFPVWSSGSTNPQNYDGDAAFDGKKHDFDTKKPESEVILSPSSSAPLRKQDDKTKKEAKGKKLEDITYSDDENDVDAEADFNNLETSITVSPIPITRIHKDHPISQIIGDLSSTTQTRSMTRVVKDQEEPKRVHQALKDPSWIEAMQKELLQFKMQKVWVLVDLPHGKRAICTKWVFRNKKDERGIVVKNKARLVAQGHTHEEEINYKEVFAPVARIEAIRLFLAYATFMGFMVYQMDVKSAFLYETIEEEVNIYVDDIIFGATNKYLCKSFEKLMKDKFQMSSMGELTFFLGLQVKQKKDGIFISQDKYVAEILRKFGLTEGKSASTPIDTEKPLLKDPNLKRIFRYLKGKPHLGLCYLKDSPFDLVAYSNSDYAGASLDRKSTTEECQFLGCRLISWQCKKQTVVATSSTEVEYVAATSCCAQVNDVTRLQALVDKKKVVVTEAAIREVLRLDDAEGVDCLPNEEIFTELAKMGYEKLSTKLTFYKAFFSSQWKFLIHTILQCMSAKQTSWNEFSSSMASAVICLSIGNLLTHTTKYALPTLTQKVFSNIRRVGKGFSGVKTPLFEGMLVQQEIEEEGDVDEHVEDDTAGDDAHEDDTSAHGEVPTVQHTPPQSPQVQPQPQPQSQQDANFPMSILQEALDACAALTRRVEHLEYDNVAQTLEITKLKRRVKKLEKGNKVRVLKLRRLQRVGTSQRVDTSDDTVMDDESNQGRIIDEMDKDDVVVLMDEKEEDKKVKEAKVDESAKVQERQAESQAKIYKIDIDHASKVLSMQEDEPAEVQKVVDVVTIPTATITVAPAKVVAAPSRRRKGVVIRDPKEESTTSSIISTETKSKDKGKRIMVEEPKPLKKKQRIEMDEEYARKLHAELNKDIDWDVAIDHVKIKDKADPAVHDDTKEKMEKEENKSLQTINETPAEKAAKRRKLNKEVEDLKRQLEIVPDEDDDVYTEATPRARKLILLVERRYPLSRFTLDQMLNNVRLQVEEESKVSLELLRFTRQQHQEGQL